MKYANYNGVKTHAKNVLSGTKATDLWFTDYEVIACVGKYRQYWKYVNEKPILPNGYESESEWHALWKSFAKDEYCEVICGNNNEHRADIKTNSFVIEIQKSSICGFDVEKRIEFYKNLTENRLVWLINVETPWRKKRISTKLDYKSKDERFTIKWSYPWRWVLDIAKTKDTFLFIDFNVNSEKIMFVWDYQGTLFGKWVKKIDFLNRYISKEMKEIYKEENKILQVFKQFKN